MSVTMTMLAGAIALSTFAAASNHEIVAFNTFHPIKPTVEQVGNYSTAEFLGWYNEKGWRKPFWYQPPSYYECRFHGNPLLSTSAFSCDNINLETPEDIFELKMREPDCLHVDVGDVAYERLQWGIWSHSCWKPNSPQAKIREIILWQHDSALLHANRDIQKVLAMKEAQVKFKQDELDAKIQMWNDEAALAIQKERAIPRKIHWFKIRDILHKRNHKIKKAKKDLAEDRKVLDREFWIKSWEPRAKVIQIDHLVGPYFDRMIKGTNNDSFDWVGYGEPSPKTPPFPFGNTWTPNYKFSDGQDHANATSIVTGVVDVDHNSATDEASASILPTEHSPSLETASTFYTDSSTPSSVIVTALENIETTTLDTIEQTVPSNEPRKLNESPWPSGPWTPPEDFATMTMSPTTTSSSSMAATKQTTFFTFTPPTTVPTFWWYTPHTPLRSGTKTRTSTIYTTIWRESQRIPRVTPKTTTTETLYGRDAAETDVPGDQEPFFHPHLPRIPNAWWPYMHRATTPHRVETAKTEHIFENSKLRNDSNANPILSETSIAAVSKQNGEASAPKFEISALMLELAAVGLFFVAVV